MTGIALMNYAKFIEHALALLQNKINPRAFKCVQLCFGNLGLRNGSG